MNLTNDKILMLVVAFLLGYFANRILKGCRTVEGIDNKEIRLNKWLDNIPEFKCNDLEKIAREKIVATPPAEINDIKYKMGKVMRQEQNTIYYNFVDECFKSGECGLREIPETSGEDGVPLLLYCNNDDTPDDTTDDKMVGDFKYDT